MRVFVTGYNVPIVSNSLEKTNEHSSWVAYFAGMDAKTSSAKTQQQLGGRPTQPGLLADIDRVSYFQT